MSKAIVIKIGTNVVCEVSGRPDPSYLLSLAAQCHAALQKGHKIVLVMSGAIGSGMEQLKLPKRPEDIVLRQVCASVGQPRLMQHLQDAFSKYNRTVAQILVSKHTLSLAQTRNNMIAATNRMLDMGIIPIINENDAIATDEIEINFGDNDELSSEFAVSIEAQGLLMLTTADGVLKDDQPLKEVSAKDIDQIKIHSSSGLGKGGMASKLRSTLRAAMSIPNVAIANGRAEKVIELFCDGQAVGTRIRA